MAKKVINSFNAGELSPYLYARTDLDKYGSGCLVMENFAPLPYGGATRRPALEFISDSKQADKVRLIPFSPSSEDSYVLEFGDFYVRFYKDGSQVTTTYSAWDDDTELEQAAGILRTESGNFYRCVENHFTGEFDVALAAGEWQVLSDWDSSIAYVVNDVIIHEGAKYISILNGTNQEPPNATYWTPVSSSVFAVDTVYALYDVVEYNDDFYEALIGYTSAGFSEDLASGFWVATTATDLAYEIPTVYAVANLPDVKFVQSVDVMWLAHPTNPIQVLSRLGDLDWTFAEESFDYPPLLDENDTDISMIPSASSGDITIESTEDYFDSDMVGGYMQIVYGRSRSAPVASGNISQNGVFSEELDVSGVTWSVEIEANGDRRGGYVQRNINAAGWITQFTFNGNGTGEYEETTPEGANTLVRFGSDKIKGCGWSLFSGNTISVNEDLGAAGGVDTVDTSSPLNVSFVNWTLETSSPPAGATTHWRGLVEVEKSSNGVDGWEKYLTIGDTTNTSDTGAKDFSFSTDEPEGADTWIRVKYTKGKADEADDEMVLNLFTTDPKFYGFVQITGYTSATEVSATVISTLGGSGATLEWSDGAFSTFRGFPQAIALFENRLCYAGTSDNPHTIWMSALEDYANFRLGDLDTEGMKLTLNSGKLDDIRWMVPQERLVIGTAGSEWSLGASDERKAITPTGFDLKRKTTYGSNTVQAILVNSAVLFLMRQSRKVREWTPNYNIQDYVAPDLSILAEHITDGGVVQWDYQQQPDNVLWSIRADGTLLGFTYERDQNVSGWHRHNNDAFEFESIAVIPRDNEGDELWVSIKITVDAVVKRYVARLNDREWGTDYLTEWQGSDLYASYTSPGSRILTDLDHLEGKEIVSVADGTIVDTVPYEITVSGTGTGSDRTVPFIDDFGGKPSYFISPADTYEIRWETGVGKWAYITTDDTWTHPTDTGMFPPKTGWDIGINSSTPAPTLAYTLDAVNGGGVVVPLDSYTTVVVGLPFTSTLAPIYLELESQVGSTRGTKKDVRHATIRFKDTFSAKISGDDGTKEDVRFSFDSADVPLFDGDYESWFDNESLFLKACYVFQEDPMPCTVLAMVPNLEVK